MAGRTAGRFEKITLVALGISDGDVQAYFEAHLLSLPGWAGMMLWRSPDSRGTKKGCCPSILLSGFQWSGCLSNLICRCLSQSLAKRRSSLL
ncbi:Na-translocating system protein MpsB [Vibrio hannami]|nr:putative inorganic carbon transporter subunit DabA [Vibrio hannami]MDG3086573.1 Na-translocating system protein MpsB [Vibrio hannami]